MSDYPPPQQPPGAAPDQPGPDDRTSRYQPYPGPGPYPGGQYGGAQYPGPGHYGGAGPYPGGSQPPAGPPGTPPPGSPAGRGGAEFQQRLIRRPEPRFTTAVAGIGIGMALFGILIWGFTYWIQGVFDDPSTSRNILGAVLALALVVIGLGLAVTQRHGPLASAGVVATGIGVPMAMLFFTLDPQSSNGINYDAVFWVSFVVWGVCYAVVPGMRGHTFFIFLMSDQLIAYVLSKATSHLTTTIFTGNAPELPSNDTIAAIGLGFGLGYYLLAFLLDHTGRHGPATGLVFTAFLATGFGIAALGPDIHLLGAGILAAVIGIAICWYGARYGRRLTCFAAAAGAAAGIGMVIADQVDNDAGVKAGVIFLIVGLVMVGIAALLARALNDPDDMVAGPVQGSR
jgi:hypothetical protein